MQRIRADEVAAGGEVAAERSGLDVAGIARLIVERMLITVYQQHEFHAIFSIEWGGSSPRRGLKSPSQHRNWLKPTVQVPGSLSADASRATAGHGGPALRHILCGASANGPTRRFGSAAGDCADDQVWLLARYDRIGQRGIRRLVREILLAGEEADKGPPLLRDLIADRAAQHRVLGLDGVEDRRCVTGPSIEPSAPDRRAP